MVIYLILFLGMLNWTSFMSSRVLMSLYAIELGASAAAPGLRFSIVNLTHMIIPLAFGTLGSTLGLITVFFANSALMLGGSYYQHRGSGKA